MAEQPSTTAVRIKRKAVENPSGAIVLANKRARITSDESSDNFTFEYAGTVNTRDDVDAAIEHVKQAKRQRVDPKIHSVNIQSKLRDEHRSSSKQNRLQLLLQHRAILKEEVYPDDITDENLEAPRESAHSLFQLYDVFAEDNQKDDTKENVDPEKNKSEIACNDVPMAREAVKEENVDEDYVYDIYYNNIHCNFIREDEFCLFSCGPPNAFAPERDFLYDSDPGFDAHDGDETDSNAEDNWRNDYPEDEDVGVRKQLDMYADYFEDMATSSVRDRLDGLTLVFSDDEEPNEPAPED